MTFARTANYSSRFYMQEFTKSHVSSVPLQTPFLDLFLTFLLQTKMSFCQTKPKNNKNKKNTFFFS